MQHGEWSDKALGAKPNPVTLGRSVLETSIKSILDIVLWLVEWHVYTLVVGFWYLHTSINANSVNVQHNRVCCGTLACTPDCAGWSSDGVMAILKSPIQRGLSGSEPYRPGLLQGNPSYIGQYKQRGPTYNRMEKLIPALLVQHHRNQFKRGRFSNKDRNPPG